MAKDCDDIDAESTGGCKLPGGRSWLDSHHPRRPARCCSARGSKAWSPVWPSRSAGAHGALDLARRFFATRLYPWYRFPPTFLQPMARMAPTVRR